MTRSELIEILSGFVNRLKEEDQSQRIKDLESMVSYLKNEVQQKEIKILKLQTVIAEIRNSVNQSGSARGKDE